MTKTTITINGRVYDAITGMPAVGVRQQHTIRTAAPQQVLATPARPAQVARVAPAVPHHAVHQVPQKSQTLYRKALKKPITAQASATPAPIPATARHAAHKRSPMISRFQGVQAPQTLTPALQPIPQQREVPMVPPQQHPVVTKALNRQAVHAQAQKELSGKELKEMLIKERLNEVDTTAKTHKKPSIFSRQPRLASILTASLAVLLLGGYLTYLALPNISLRVAASRAGVSASMPEYKPDGYSLNGPISYSPGEVIIAYKSNTNETGYSLSQKATNWDSQGVLDNYVSRITDNYLTFQERGITVYTFGNKAAWVNGGLLYTIDGDAALSSDQILRVATSL